MRTGGTCDAALVPTGGQIKKLSSAVIKGRTQTGFTGFYWTGNIGVNVQEKCFNLKKTCFGASTEAETL